VPDEVCVVWSCLLEKPLEVVHRRPHRMLVVACDGRDAPHIGVARLPTVAIVTVSHGCSPLKALFAPLVAAFDALLSTVSSDVGRHLLITAWCHHPTSPCGVKHGHLVASGALGGDVVQLLKCAPEEFIMFVVSWALCVLFRQCARATLVCLAVNLWFTMPSLPLPWQGLG
jgi:hypothetical protein